MKIRVEFYGIPRQRAGTAEADVTIPADDARLADVLRRLAADFPALAETCIETDRLKAGCAVNVNGERFVTDRAARMVDGETLLFMSADMGG